MGSSICSGTLEKVWLKKSHCPTCGKKRFFVYELWEWYGIYVTCLKCGEKFTDEGRMDRPFCPGWRKTNIRNAKRFYRQILTNRPEGQKGEGLSPIKKLNSSKIREGGGDG